MQTSEYEKNDRRLGNIGVGKLTKYGLAIYRHPDSLVEIMKEYGPLIY